MTEREEQIVQKLMGLLPQFKLARASTMKAAKFLAQRLGPVSIDLRSAAGRILVREAIRRMPNTKAKSGRQFQSATGNDEKTGKPKRFWVQLEFASDEERLSILRGCEANALAAIHSTNNIALDIISFGTQVELPFPQYLDAEEGAK